MGKRERGHCLPSPPESGGGSGGVSGGYPGAVVSARKRLRLGGPANALQLERELINLLINKKIIKHWREGYTWAHKDVQGKMLDAYR